MSVNTGTEVDVLTLVGDMPDLPCESNNHGDPHLGHNHDDGPAKYYMQMMHECSWIGKGEIYAACAKSAANIAGAQQRQTNCLDCGTKHLPPGEWVRVVGPIKKGRE